MLIRQVIGLMTYNAEHHALVLDGTPETQRFTLAEEVALSISYNGINYAVMLVTPKDIEDFIIGFSLSNDIIEHPRQLYGIELTYHKEHINAEVEPGFLEVKRK
ncbi:Formate dehydrogenase (fragment) [Alteromonas infernus]